MIGGGIYVMDRGYMDFDRLYMACRPYGITIGAVYSSPGRRDAETLGKEFHPINGAPAGCAHIW